MRLRCKYAGILFTIGTSACGGSGGFFGAASDANTAKKKDSGSATNGKVASTDDGSEDILATEAPSNVSGAFLVQCAAAADADGPDGGPPSGKAWFGCGVADATTKKKAKRKVATLSVTFDDGQVEEATLIDAKPKSKFSALAAFVKERLAKIKAAKARLDGETVGRDGSLASPDVIVDSEAETGSSGSGTGEAAGSSSGPPALAACEAHSVRLLTGDACVALVQIARYHAILDSFDGFRYVAGGEDFGSKSFALDGGSFWALPPRDCAPTDCDTGADGSLADGSIPLFEYTADSDPACPLYATTLEVKSILDGNPNYYRYVRMAFRALTSQIGGQKKLIRYLEAESCGRRLLELEGTAPPSDFKVEIETPGIMGQP